MRSTSSPLAVSMMIATLVSAGAQAPADGEAVLAGQHEVEHHEVVAHALQAGAPSPAASGTVSTANPCSAEVALEQVAQAQVVVDHEDLLAGLRFAWRIDVSSWTPRSREGPYKLLPLKVFRKRLRARCSAIRSATIPDAGTDPNERSDRMKYVLSLTAAALARAATIAIAAPQGAGGHRQARCWSASRRPTPTATDSSAGTKRRRCRALAKHFDEIDTDRQRAAVRPTSCAPSTQDAGAAREHFRKIDTDGDGRISLAEAQANAPRLADVSSQIDANERWLHHRRGRVKAAHQHHGRGKVTAVIAPATLRRRGFPEASYAQQRHAPHLRAPRVRRPFVAQAAAIGYDGARHLAEPRRASAPPTPRLPRYAALERAEAVDRLLAGARSEAITRAAGFRRRRRSSRTTRCAQMSDGRAHGRSCAQRHARRASSCARGGCAR